MFGFVKKVYLKPVLFVSLFLVFLFVSSTASFAVENQAVDNNTQKIYAQSSESNSFGGSVADYILSLVTPNDACAEDATPVLTCKDYCYPWKPGQNCGVNCDEDNPLNCANCP